MKIDPPIPVNLPTGPGEIIEMADDESEVTVRLRDGSTIKIDGSAPAQLWETMVQ